MYSIVLMMALSGGGETISSQPTLERPVLASRELNRGCRCACSCGCYGWSGCGCCCGWYSCGSSCGWYNCGCSYYGVGYGCVLRWWHGLCPRHQRGDALHRGYSGAAAGS